MCCATKIYYIRLSKRSCPFLFPNTVASVCCNLATAVVAIVVIVCTRNPGKFLNKLLKSLRRFQLPTHTHTHGCYGNETARDSICTHLCGESRDRATGRFSSTSQNFFNLIRSSHVKLFFDRVDHMCVFVCTRVRARACVL